MVQISKMAKFMISLVLLLMTIVAHAQRTYDPFNCQRLNSPCAAAQGGQCQADGSCRCTNTNFGGYNCALLRSSILTGAGCTTACENNGVCYANAGIASCFCTEGYYGSNCQRKRVDITGCDGDNINVVVNPHETGVFNGRIYVLGLIGSPQCNIDVVGTGLLRGFTKTLSLNAEVAGNNACRAGLTVTDNGRTKSYSVVVQYDPAMITSTDEIHTFQCSQTNTGQFVGFVLSGVDFNTVSRDRLTGTDVNVGHVPLGMTITTQPNRGAISQSVVRVGDDLFIEISLTSSTTFASIKIEELQASDGINNPTQTKQLVQNGCPLTVTNGISVGTITKPNPRIVLIPFKMFKYLNSDSVYFSARATLCTSLDLANCDPSTCSGQANGFGRKKRQTDSRVTRETATRVFVVSPGDNTVAAGSCVSEHVVERCVDNPAFIAVVSLVGILLLVAIIIMLVLCLRVHRNRKEKGPDTPFPPPAVTRM